MTDFLTAVGRILLGVVVNFPLSIHFLDEDYANNEGNQLEAGLGVLIGLIIACATIITIATRGRL